MIFFLKFRKNLPRFNESKFLLTSNLYCTEGLEMFALFSMRLLHLALYICLFKSIFWISYKILHCENSVSTFIASISSYLIDIIYTSLQEKDILFETIAICIFNINWKYIYIIYLLISYSYSWCKYIKTYCSGYHAFSL